jgi:nucleoside-diphosphate-sugar epimerase
MSDRVRSLVAGAGGFIGGHLVRQLLARDHDVVAVDAKQVDHWYQVWPGATNLELDLSLIDSCRDVVAGVSNVYNLAADMGGIGFIEGHKAQCMLSVLINTHMLIAARESRAQRFFYASSACVYPAGRQDTPEAAALAEDHAYPAMPEDGYGWEKLFSERMCRHFQEDFGIQTRVARYHNVYGPHGTYDGGREKAPAAICRKVAHAALTGAREIEIWGDGEQTRSFMYIDDCVDGTIMIAEGDSATPVNLGSSELVSINQLVDTVEDIAGITLRRRYLPDAPQGVRGRNSDNRLITELFDWEPTVGLRAGLENTYGWIREQVARDLGASRHNDGEEGVELDRLAASHPQ